ncbi:triphosphoribosyl-dephospho-CoA synthase/triphosphoribosyl-dephospho-CoA synthase [Rhodobacter aestuarii]|uniref:Probable 2-(5''-triphosphoribosyl)-3'-dephosphocoenzyme-A synthase n=1 Tax=Rhodobacter aestuarii TaxID=453582 RepID=A0A1N7KBZ4_9RHOB|nr:triphosphoribosyl-dephospho-CoA synthase MdcB [Rhodobacter aestuarii]PTV95770.1 triphosphoribosyl-dephospho-CoA synthase/triphosphoribosyl-dephospho-CoA synthase [Rhodobacter aestuarii]SIS59059.1 triphosphoribosyl-dephospho-CoA synthase/triphosphoribosyl-dephospho-CoA synthase [Rhodobacter aestuarii]
MKYALRRTLDWYSDMSLWPQSNAWSIGSAFLTGALLEISTHPKPGLVTPRSNGSHEDMNIQTFMVSSAVIAPCLYQCAELGLGHNGPAWTLLAPVREIGARYESRLLAATQGVNTQRGLLFSAGILSAAAGSVMRLQPTCTEQDLFATATDMVRGICDRELRSLGNRAPRTAGEKLYKEYGVLGIRGEAEAGFPTVRSTGLPALRAARDIGAPLSAVLLDTLLALMTETEDTTLLWRGGPEALAFVQAEARRIRALGGALTEAGMEAIHAFDAACIARHLSPGGSADLLAVTIGVDALLGGQLPPATSEHGASPAAAPQL